MGLRVMEWRGGGKVLVKVLSVGENLIKES